MTTGRINQVCTSPLRASLGTAHSAEEPGVYPRQPQWLPTERSTRPSSACLGDTTAQLGAYTSTRGGPGNKERKHAFQEHLYRHPNSRMKKHALPEQTCSHCVLIPTSVHEEMHPRAIKCYANPNNNHYTLVLIAKRLGRLLTRSRGNRGITKTTNIFLPLELGRTQKTLILKSAILLFVYSKTRFLSLSKEIS